MVNAYVLLVVPVNGGQPSQTVMQSATAASSAASSINGGTAAKAYVLNAMV